MQNGYWKCDLHVHTPLSSCYEESERHVSAHEIVAAAVHARLDLIAVTDHNGVGSVDRVRQAAEGTGLVVLPGVELTTPGGHILGLFDRDTTVEHVRRLLDEVGMALTSEGVAFIETTMGTLEVLATIEALGGVAIAAHIERSPRGFMQSTYDFLSKRAIHASHHLAALEITDPSSKAAWNEGTVRGYPKPYPCIQGSDAHAPSEIGRRPVFMHLPSPDLPGLRHALAHYRDAIKFPYEPGVGG